MPRAGGEADKVGNRYERWWTAAVMLELLRDEDGVICVEPGAGEGDGIEFWRQRRDVREVHQVKRQSGFDGGWTLVTLRSRKVVESWKKHLADPTVHAYFVSAISVAGLRELTERARSSPSAKAFVRECYGATNTERELKKFTDEWGGLPDEESRDVLRRIHIRTIGEEDLREKAAALAAPWFDSSHEVVAEALASFAWDNMNRELRPVDIWAGLRARLISPRPSRDLDSLALALEAQTAAYMEGGNSIGRNRLKRPEVADIVADLRQERRTVWVVGDAGSGKSEVIRDLVRELRLDWPVLAFRLDRLEPTNTAAGVGQQLGLQLGPVEALAAVAQGKPALLVIDQLDAVSIVSGRRAGLLEVVQRVLRAAQHHAQLRAVIACRKFDLDNDHRLRASKANEPAARTYTLEGLTPEEVRSTCVALGHQVGLSDAQVRILGLPLHLSLLADILSTGEALGTFDTTAALFAEYVRRKQHALRERDLTDQWGAVVTRLLDHMNVEESLSAPWRVLAPEREYAEAMVSEHVLVRDGPRVAFFHEALFDYLFGQRFDQHTLLADWLRDGEQGSFRRAQLRQVLSFRRDDSPAQYRRDLRALLLEPGVRFHLQHLVLAVLGRQPAPTDEEAAVVRELLRSSDTRRARCALDATRGSLAWFRRLQDPLRSMLDGQDPDARQQALWWLAPLVKHDPDAVVAFLQPWTDAGEEWSATLAWFVSCCHGYTGSAPFVRLIVQLIERGAFDLGVGPRDLWLSLGYSSEPTVWAGASTIAAALLRRDTVLRGNRVYRPRASTPGAEVLLMRLADEAPARFVEIFVPVLVEAAAATAEADPRSGIPRDALSAAVGEPFEESLRSALLEAVVVAVTRTLAMSDPGGDTALSSLVAGSTWTPTILTARIYTEVGATRADEAVDWLLADARRFELERWAVGAWSEALIRSVGANCSPVALQRLERALVNYSPPCERRRQNAKHRGRSRWRLLCALPADRLSGPTRREVARLTKKFGSQTDPAFKGMQVFNVPSPISEDESRRMTDDEWLHAFALYREERWTWGSDGRARGGASQLAKQLIRRVAEEPERFATVALRLPDDVNPVYAAAILGGLQSASLAIEHLERLVLWAHAFPERPLGREVVDLIKANAGLPWSDRVLQIVKWYAMESAHPDIGLLESGLPLGERVWTTGINSVRGAAAECLGALVERDGSRLPSLRSAIVAVVEDPAAAVRACAAVACLGLLRHDDELALQLTGRLVEVGGAAPAAPPVEKLIWRLGHRHAERLLPLLTQLVESEVSEVALVGARQASLLGLNCAAARPLAERCLRGEAPLRRGAADILAANVVEAAYRNFCEKALVGLFDDEAPEVRGAAAEVFRGQESGSVDELRDVALAFVDSRAFADHANTLILWLQASTLDGSAIIVRAAERFLEIHGKDAGNIQTRAALTVHLLQPLIVRAYASADPGSELRRRCLDVIDAMCLHGVLEMEEVVERPRR